MGVVVFVVAAAAAAVAAVVVVVVVVAAAAVAAVVGVGGVVVVVFFVVALSLVCVDVGEFGYFAFAQAFVLCTRRRPVSRTLRPWVSRPRPPASLLLLREK